MPCKRAWLPGFHWLEQRVKIRVRKGFEYSVEHPQTKIQGKTLQEEGPIQSKKQM